MRKRWTISGTYLSVMMILMVLTLSGFGGLCVVVEYKRFRTESEQIHSHFMETRKTSLALLADRLATTLDRDIALAERSLKQQLKERVLETCSLLMAIHSEAPENLPEKTRLDLMRNALRKVRSEDNQRFFFALDTDGTLLFNSIRPELDGTPIHALADGAERPIARQIVGTALTEGEGYLTYSYPKPGDPEGPLYLKTSYIRFMPRLGWIVGSGYYHDDFYREIQPRIIRELPPMSDGQGGEIVIFTDDGTSLLGPPSVASHAMQHPPSGWDTAGKVLDHTATEDVRPFLAYLQPYGRWGWTIGAAAHPNTIVQCINEKQAELKKRVYSHLRHVLAILFTTLIMAVAVSALFSRHLARSFAFFSTFFKQASRDFTTIDPDKLLFQEFKALADSANRMSLERKLSERALRENEEKYRTLMDNTLQGVMIIQHQRIVFANAACGSISGRSPEELCQASTETLWDWTHPEDTPYVWKNYDAILHNPDTPPMTWEYRIQHRNGAFLWIEITVSHLRYLGDSAVLCTFSDITPRKAAEMELTEYRERLEDKVAEKTRELTEAKNLAESALEAKGRFLANISHEIKTPMNAIMGVAGLMASEALPEKQQGYIDIINRSSRALMTLINDILDFSRAKSGKITAEAFPFNYMELMEEVADTFTPQAEEKNLDLLLDIDPDLPPSITGDPLRIRQVLVNLTANAVKFTHSGSITLACRVVQKEAGLITLKTEVIDTGIGIDLAKLPHGDARILFEAFSQADSSTTREYGGTGLGLAICKKIMDLIGGTLNVTSKPGEGSCFSFQMATPWNASQAVPRAATTGNAIVVGLPSLEEDVARRTLQWQGYAVELIRPDEQRPTGPSRWDVAFWLLSKDQLESRETLDWPVGLKGTLVLCPAALYDSALSLLKGRPHLIVLKKPLKPSHLMRRLAEIQGALAPIETPPQDTDETAESPPCADGHALLQALVCLRDKLTHNKFDTDTEIKLLKTMLPNTMEPLIEDLVHNIEHFNYYTALATLEKIIASCSDDQPLTPETAP